MHGDPRGFRDPGHRAHSSGDYRNPPPRGEHAGLYRLRKERARPKITLVPDVTGIIGKALVQYFTEAEYRLLAVAVTREHADLLVELPDNILKVRAIVGNAKRLSSRAVKRSMPGTIWAAGGTYKPIRDIGHQRNTYAYILHNQGPDAWT